MTKIAISPNAGADRGTGAPDPFFHGSVSEAEQGTVPADRLSRTVRILRQMPHSAESASGKQRLTERHCAIC
ncbi:MAG: hypothetical protein IKI58_11990 [Oscillospiraceae bacterium]|nr:hypothetical protein [Oscillospiraceae bacterium]